MQENRFRRLKIRQQAAYMLISGPLLTCSTDHMQVFGCGCAAGDWEESLVMEKREKTSQCAAEFEGENRASPQ